MKIRAFSCTLLLLSLILCFSSGIYAQSRNPQQKLKMEFSGTKLMGELINVIPVEVRDVQPRAVRKFNQWELPKHTSTVSNKSVSEWSASQDGQSVTLYENPDFGGRSKSFGIGSHRLLDFNGVASSIKVPDGLVAIVYEYSDEAGGYGRWVDFLEDQPNLAKYNFKISYLLVFKNRKPEGSIWARNSVRKGQFMAGYWYDGSQWAPVNKGPVVGPPIVRSVRTPSPAPAPRSTTCTISGQVAGDRPAYGTHINLFVPGDRNPRVSVSVINGQYTIPNVPEGSYEVRSKMNNPMTHQTPRGPVGLKAVALGDQAVTCEKGQPVRVNFKIVSSE
jgi:hypothetical protein